MTACRVFLLLCVLVCTIQCQTSKPLIVAHRGVPSHRVEETFPSYELAASYHADFIECDLCVTQDRVLVLRHECNLDETTDVAEHPEFASKKRAAKTGRSALEGDSGWFTEDFTLAELRTLRTKERLTPDVRTAAYDRLFQIITLDEFLQNAEALRGNNSMPPSLCGNDDKLTLGLYIETKTPAYFKKVMPDFDLEGALLKSLERFQARCEVAEQYKDTDTLKWVKECGIILQSFENNLAELDCPYPKVQLLESSGNQADTLIPYTQLMTEEELTKIKQWAVGIGPAKSSCLNYTDYTSTGLVERAHSVGLMVHPYTFRPEPYYMKGNFDDDPIQEFFAFFDLGVDGVFTDSCDVAYSAVNQYYVETSTATDVMTVLFYAFTGLVIAIFLTGIVVTAVFYMRHKSSKNIQYVIPDNE